MAFISEVTLHVTIAMNLVKNAFCCPGRLQTLHSVLKTQIAQCT